MVKQSDTRAVWSKRLSTAATYLFLTILLLIVLFPTVWVVGQSFMREEQILKWARSNRSVGADARQFHRDLHHQAFSARTVLIPLAI